MATYKKSQTKLTKAHLIASYKKQHNQEYEDIFEFARDYYGLLGTETCKLLTGSWWDRLMSKFSTIGQANVISGGFNTGTITQVNRRG